MLSVAQSTQSPVQNFLQIRRYISFNMEEINNLISLLEKFRIAGKVTAYTEAGDVFLEWVCDHDSNSYRIEIPNIGDHLQFNFQLQERNWLTCYSQWLTASSLRVLPGWELCPV